MSVPPGKLQVAIGFLKNSRMDPSREVIRHLWELGVQTLLEGGLYRTPSLPMESSGSIYESVDIILRIQQNISTAQSAQGKQLTCYNQTFKIIWVLFLFVDKIIIRHKDLTA